ncbi:histidinol dehydrogenase [Natrialbaceae archaeon AArc-T1-2]|uniref:histidinol dehydrogenase n=1 Tax=Natrialbaceae archaeon AArc-T1-2 TaxID=3053904 RepID=UPI00255A7C3D|nr:histidinol dehydrogenase [Natrialbaceae archaeon AArc-T1-2]WIV68733.1 histidinol dehydrogenase [Natrialbaceae archaeon AArc-T1-2]
MAIDVKYLKETSEQAMNISEDVTDSVKDILGSVRADGDDAIREFTRRFDGVERETLQVSPEEIELAEEFLEAGERAAIDATIENVREFHEEQFKHVEGFEKEFCQGTHLGMRVVPIERAGVYIPGGEHPLVATPAMTIVPATVVGVDHIIACVPPQDNGTVTPAQLYAMDQAGVDEIYCIGGAQAIGAMAYGTESVPAVDIVTGPGNIFTTEAKRQVFGTVGIDFLAGPTEVLIITDETVDPTLVATDILAQAEHDKNSRPTLITTSGSHAEAVIAEINAQLPDLQTEEIARECWETNGEVAVVPDRETAVELANEYAMEHLQLMVENPRELVEDLHNYGSLFIGDHAPVVFGDKAVGTNHCLPTLGVARYSSGIWVGTYLKTPTHQELTAEAAANLADHTSKICEIEGTHAHQLSAKARRRDD